MTDTDTSTKIQINAYRDHHHASTAVIIGNGPSASREKLTHLSRYPDTITIGLNRAWELGTCDYYCIGDDKQFEHYARTHGDLSTLRPLWTVERDSTPQHKGAIRVNALAAVDHKRFSFDLIEGVYLNNTITSYALQLCVWFGVRAIHLIGVDAKGSHFYGDAKPIPDRKFANQRETLGYIAGVLHYARPGLEILNLSPESAVNVFTKRPFENAYP